MRRSIEMWPLQNNFLLDTVMLSDMARTIEAEYIARENILKLAQPLRGVADHAMVSIEVKDASVASDQPWLALAGSLSEEEGRELARAVRDAFGREEIEV